MKKFRKKSFLNWPPHYLNKPGKTGHNKHRRIVLRVDDQLAGGERCHVLVRTIGDGGVREGDRLGLGVALHVGGGKCYSCGLGGHRVWKVAVEVANESTIMAFTCCQIFYQSKTRNQPRQLFLFLSDGCRVHLKGTAQCNLQQS